MQTIFFESKITSYNFYNKFLQELSSFYKTNGGRIAPNLSLEKVEWMDTLVIPNILSLGLYLSKFHHSQIPLQISWNPRILFFLNEIGFFKIVQSKFSVYEIDERFLGGFPVDKQYRDKHKLQYYLPLADYYNKKLEDQEFYRNELFEKMRFGKVLNDYKDVIEDQGSLDSQEVKKTLDVLTELICNSILYSGTECFAFMQTNKYGSKISLSDYGIGFRKSLERKNIKLKVLEANYKIYSQKTGIDLEDFLVIMDVLSYSKSKERENLWELKNIITKNNGILRIHYQSAQVIFTHNKCKNCEEDIKKCLDCLLETADRDPQYSSARFFKTKFPGVHVEVEFTRQEGYGC
ncbi:hypothetical protein [Pelosinus sp. UFO1]|uniref:hypothetical protein n=1 Tax=Pelosinus sp. UFO1 TaxID=484770 RepID=UPI0004D1D23E|nr:hypothetical protein [Pelosinus sp. UFO1]AIF53525.1 hypothetical protein UFO1_3982 [Pelosinus sp. UFO1]